MNLTDIRTFIKDVKTAFYAKEKELNPDVRYSIIKGIVSLRIKETKMMKIKR